jgi:hypothetical protein
MTSRSERGLAPNDDELLRVVLVSSARGDSASPKTFAEALARAVETKVWLRLAGPGGRPFRSFRAFLTTPRESGGIGLAEEQLEHAAKLAGPETWQLVQMHLREEQSPAPDHGGDRRSSEAQDGGTILKPGHAESIVARLKRDDPDLAARVVRGEVTPNAAALEKGWRKPRIVVTTPADLAELMRILSGQPGEPASA